MSATWKSPYWGRRGGSSRQWRSLIPATSFCEWTDSRPKITHWFALDEKAVLCLPSPDFGAHGPETAKGESGEHPAFLRFLTTESNDTVRPIHGQGHAGGF